MGGGSEELSGPDLADGIESSELSEASTLLGHFDGEPVLLTRDGGEVLGVGAACTHYGGPLADGVVAEGTVRCPWHHACFDLRTGEALAAPALSDLPVYSVSEDGGRIRVTGKTAAPATFLEGAARRNRTPRVEPDSVVIVGGGAAGIAAAEALRREGYTGPVTVVESDGDEPCDRPNLSKDYLQGTAPEEWMSLRSRDALQENSIEVRRSNAVALDRDARELTLEDGGSVSYGALILATGAEPIRLELPAAPDTRVYTLRTLADSRAIIAAAEDAKQVVVIGASFIGLEVAASLRHRKIGVHVVAPEQVPLAKVMGPDLGAFVRSLHEKHGVEFHLGRTVAGIETEHVVLDDGSRLPADFVVAGVGVRPRVRLAKEADLEVEDGIVVDAELRTSDNAIWAAGDVARFPYRPTGERVRIEHWAFAQRMGAAAARSVLGGGAAFDSVPFFWSRHYDAVVAYVGHAEHWDDAELDGDPEELDCAVRFTRKGELLALATIFRDELSLRTEIEMAESTGA